MAPATLTIDSANPGLVFATAKANAAALATDPQAVPLTPTQYAQRVLDGAIASYLAAYVDCLEAVGNAEWRANMAAGQDPVTAKVSINTPTDPVALVAEAQARGVL